MALDHSSNVLCRRMCKKYTYFFHIIGFVTTMNTCQSKIIEHKLMEQEAIL